MLPAGYQEDPVYVRYNTGSTDQNETVIAIHVFS